MPFHLYDWSKEADDVRVEFSPDGGRLVSSVFSSDPAISQVALWQLNSATLYYSGCSTAGRNMTKEEWEHNFPGEPYHATCPAALVRDAEELALSGDRDGAAQEISAAWNAVLEMGELGREAMLANDVCWTGATIQLAKEALPACEKAVEWAEPAVKDEYRDSRSVARALTGDMSGAIEDFKAEIDWLKEEPGHAGYNDTFLRLREQWLSDLNNGKNPVRCEDARQVEDRERQIRRKSAVKQSDCWSTVEASNTGIVRGSRLSRHCESRR